MPDHLSEPKLNEHGYYNCRELETWYYKKIFPELNNYDCLKNYNMEFGGFTDRNTFNFEYNPDRKPNFVLYLYVRGIFGFARILDVPVPYDRILRPDEIVELPETKKCIDEAAAVKKEFDEFYDKYGIRPQNTPSCACNCMPRDWNPETSLYTLDMNDMTQMLVTVSDAYMYMTFPDFTEDERFPVYREFIKRCIRLSAKFYNKPATPNSLVLIVPFNPYVAAHASKRHNNSAVVSFINEAIAPTKKR